MRAAQDSGSSGYMAVFCVSFQIFGVKKMHKGKNRVSLVPQSIQRMAKSCVYFLKSCENK